MGYYTGLIYEIEYKNYPGSIGGGGRYDNMIGKLMNSNVPACGISFGFERIMDIYKIFLSPPSGGPTSEARVSLNDFISLK